MKHYARIGLLFTGVLLSSAAFAPASFAQTSSDGSRSLSYTQPLSPQGQKEIQRRLKELGAYTGAVDGIWGRDSQEALEDFQRSRGLQVTDGLNQATLATMGIRPTDLLGLDADAGTAALPAEVQGKALSTDAVRTIQGRLKQLGLYAGETDGIWGESTQAALERFQRDRGLQVTGTVTPNTLTTMGLDSQVVLAGVD
ncbi:peptidoglycan-binding protein [Skermanella rosea]|uniref:peptidoglycan-binding domain-containing protein n=1 Tax=Skermanella rosea TaxID=1817965 RepID=UPI001933440E|nr:peptidoglycan-binding protein [Skermanella rosea]UEM02585.1 peptidoglycan-binding protein [Skermanella rosea]